MLPATWTHLRYHRLQTLLWRSRARYIAVAAGRGSGKTELARRRVVRFLPVKKPWSNPLYFYALPTYNQAKRVAWRPLCDLVPPDWIKKINQGELSIETKWGSTLFVVGMDKPQRIEGVQWDGGVLDESCDQRPGSFGRSVVPALSHRFGWCWRIGVPKRFGVGAPEFKEFFDEGAAPGTSLTDPSCEHESYTWPSRDILTPAQLKWAMENLDEKDFNEQYNASWEEVSGLIFYAFDEVQNVREVMFDPEKPIIVGSDFNVNPMCWVLAQQHVNIQNATKELHVFDELFIRNTNTRATLDVLAKRYGSHRAGFDFVGDASGQARKTSASESDYIQIKNDRRFHNSRVFYPNSNPLRANRFAACNALFHNAEGLRRCFIHPRCKALIRDCTRRAYKEGTNEPDDHDDIGHITDAFGYIVHRLFPLTIKSNTKAQVYASG